MRKNYFRLSVFMFAVLALVATWTGPGFSATSATDLSGQILLAQATPRATTPRARAAAVKKRAAAKRRAAAAKRQVPPAQVDDNPTPHPAGQVHN